MQTKQFKVVLVGCGGMANAWMQNALQMPELSVVGLVDIRREAAEAMAEKYKLARSVVYGSLQEALDATKADLVFDVTIPGAHHDVVLTAIRNGCNVLGEKPLSDDLASAQEMVAAAGKAGKLYAVMQNRRFDANIRAVRKTIESGALGAVE